MPPRTSTTAATPSADRLSSARTNNVRLRRIPHGAVNEHPSSIGSTSASLLAIESGVLPPANHDPHEPPYPNGNLGNLLEEDEEAFIEPLFQTALHIVQSSLPKSGQIQPTYNDKLLLYSLFKQAVHGDVKSSTISKRPGVFDMLGRAKWDAWKAREGLSCSESKRLYVESVLKILRSHRDRPEAKVLIESLSGYEAYSTAIDHLSESDEDLYSEQKIEIPTSMPGSERTLSEQEQSEQREDEERRSEDDRSTSKLDVQSANENIQSSGLGPYKSPAQMPYPTESFDSQILPPHSPPVDETTSGSSSEPTSQQTVSSSARNDSSPPLESLESAESNPVAQSIMSEPRFTPAQVQRLVDQTPQIVSFRPGSLRSPLDNHANISTNLARLTRAPQSPDQFSSAVELLHVNIQKLNQAIDCLQLLVSKIDLHVQPSLDHPSQQSKNHPSRQTHSSPSPAHSPTKQSAFLLSLTRLRFLARNIWVKRLFFDLSLFFLLLKAWSFFTKRPARKISC